MAADERRTEIAHPRFGGDREFELPCDCVGRCECLFVAEWFYEGGNADLQSFDFYSSHRVDYWRARFRAAWAALRGKRPYYHAICSTPEQGRELGEWLLAKTDGRGQ